MHLVFVCCCPCYAHICNGGDFTNVDLGGTHIVLSMLPFGNFTPIHILMPC
uniref:Uncharacterized protein n=1 Tax=Rhizophora mucronata TaxID=61149 RepID=A0A2P2KRU8_RHIMU